jgi:hypothetical protein
MPSLPRPLLVALLLSASLCLTGCANLAGGKEKEDDDDANEVTVPIDQVPAAVKTTLTEQAGDGKIVEVEKETSGGKTTYEADVEIGGKTYEVQVAEDGKLIGKKLDEGGEDDDKGKDDDDAKPAK